MVFPKPDMPAAPRSPEDRNIAMATLVAYLGEVQSDEEAQVSHCADSANALWPSSSTRSISTAASRR